MFVMAGISFLTAVYVILTYGQPCTHSDSAIDFRFFNSVKASKQLYPDTWTTANGEVYTFNILPLTLVMNFLVKNAALSRALASAVFYAITCLGFIWLFRRCFKNQGWAIAMPLFSVYLCSDIARDMDLIQAAYNAPAIAVTVCAGLFFIILIETENTVKNMVFHSILLFIMLTGGIRYVAEYVLPLVMALPVVIFIINREQDRKYKVDAVKKSTLLLIVPSALGYLLYQYICHTHNMNFGDNSTPQIGFSLQIIGENISATCENIAIAFGYDTGRNPLVNGCIIVIAILICVVLPAFQIIKIKSLGKKEQCYIIFGLAHNLVLTGAILLCDKTEERYILSCIFVCIIISSSYLYSFIKDKNRRLGYTALAAFVLVSGFLSVKLFKVADNWKDRMAARQDICQQLLAHNVSKGYGTYWVGYPNEVYSNGRIKFGAFRIGGASLRKFVAQVDDDAFEKAEGRCCLMFTEEEYTDQINLYGVDPAVRMVGAPSESFIIENPYLQDFIESSKIIVYVYEEDICDRLTDGLTDGILTPRELDFNYVGEWSEDKIVLANGGIIHGPYITIAPGHYKVSVKGSNLEVCEFSIKSEEVQQYIEYNVESVAEDTAVIDLNIKKYVNDIQFYVINSTDEAAEFYRVEVQEKKD